MNYYKQIYDINFFTGESYNTKVNNTSIKILNPGIPDWNSWKSIKINTTVAKEIWDDFLNRDNNYFESFLFKRNIPRDEFELLSLILCEDAYRNFRYAPFFLLNRILFSSRIPEMCLKSIKLQLAWQALFSISKTKKPLNSILGHCTNFVNKERFIPTINRHNNIQVEIPVKNEWEKGKYSINNKSDVEKFYKETISYILELTAANHQVETLFNYNLILRLLKRLGVKNIFDFGAGIGTFLILSNRSKMEVIYSDLESKTSNFAQQRLENLKISANYYTLDFENPTIPQNLDCIVCTEVLEHIFEPDSLIEKFYQSLKPGGILVVSESFDYIEEFCTHIPSHKGKGDQIFLEFLNKKGFRQIKTRYTIHPSIHVKF